MSSKNIKKQAESENPAAFTFIVSTGTSFSITPEERSIIRKQAMKKAGTARKVRGNYGKINMIQYPTIMLPRLPEKAEKHATLGADTPACHEGRQRDQLVFDPVKESDGRLRAHTLEQPAPVEINDTDHHNLTRYPAKHEFMLPSIPHTSQSQQQHGHPHSESPAITFIHTKFPTCP